MKKAAAGLSRRTIGNRGGPGAGKVSARVPKAVQVAAALVFHGGRLLVTQRPAGSHLAGYWEFPGGKREAGETFKDCLIREIREELGIEIKPGQCLAQVTHSYPEKRVHIRFFLAEWEGGQPQAIGCAAWLWVSREELASLVFPAADQKLLDRLKDRASLWARKS